MVADHVNSNDVYNMSAIFNDNKMCYRSGLSCLTNWEGSRMQKYENT
jgi:hypothetical protein